MYRMGKAESDEVSKVIKAQKMFRVGDPKTGHLQEANRFEKDGRAPSVSSTPFCSPAAARRD